MTKLGAHISFSKASNYIIGAVETSLNWGANTFMVFLGPPQSSRRVPIENLRINEYKDTTLSDAIPPEDIIVHAPYITNPANPHKQEFAINFLTKEMKVAEEIGVKYIVLHPGSSGDQEVEDALKVCANTIKQLLENTKNINIAIETMSGKGREIGINFHQIKKIIDYVGSDRVNVCFDTCHVWDSGYNIKKIDLVLEEFDSIIGLERLKVVHLNDSKNEINSHKDRHANIGEGHIGFKALQAIVHHPKLQGIPMILETPWVDNKPIYKKEISMLLKRN